MGPFYAPLTGPGTTMLPGTLTARPLLALVMVLGFALLVVLAFYSDTFAAT